jgi:hypothetical protein
MIDNGEGGKIRNSIATDAKHNKLHGANVYRGRK